MPQMELQKYETQSNVEILNAIREIQTSDYQARVPEATKANIDSTIDNLFNYTAARNAFTDSLVNLIGMIQVRYNVWSNPLAPFKKGFMQFGETFEETAIGLIKAKAYNPDADALEQELFGKESNEVQSRWHKINRQDRYKVSVNRNQLRRAFQSTNGLSEFVSGLMAQLATSDQWDEFLITANLFKKYDEGNGFFKVNIPDLTADSADEADAKFALRKMRSMAGTLPFLSRKYNAAHMPMSAQPENLILVTTPDAQATIDVEGLAAAFHIDKAQVETERTVTLPPEYIDIPGFQALLTTKEFFIILDQFMEMQSLNNPAGLYQNFWWHHHELVSVSPFVPAVLFTSEGSTTITVIDYNVDSISALTLYDNTDESVVTNGNVARGGSYVVSGSAITVPAGGPNDGLTLRVSGNHSERTRITQQGVLFVGFDDDATTITVHAVATDDDSFEKDLTLTLTGPVVQGSIGLTVDDAPTVISNRTKPKISPNGGANGTVFEVSNGTWDTRDLTFAYQWKKGGTNISGATDNTYTSVSGDAGSDLTCSVTASRTGYTSSAAILSSAVHVS